MTTYNSIHDLNKIRISIVKELTSLNHSLAHTQAKKSGGRHGESCRVCFGFLEQHVVFMEYEMLD